MASVSMNTGTYFLLRNTRFLPRNTYYLSRSAGFLFVRTSSLFGNLCILKRNTGTFSLPLNLYYLLGNRCTLFRNISKRTCSYSTINSIIAEKLSLEEKEAIHRKSRDGRSINALFVNKSIRVFLVNVQSMSLQEWGQLFTHNPELKKTKAIDYIILKYCVDVKKLELAKSYIDYIQSCSRNLSLSGTLQYLVLCARTKDNEGFQSVYQKLEKEYLLPEQRATIVNALCATDEWKKSYQDMELMEKSYKSVIMENDVIFNVYEDISLAIAKNEGFNEAFKFLTNKKMNENGISESLFIKFIDVLDQQAYDRVQYQLLSNKLLTFLSSTTKSDDFGKYLLGKLNCGWSSSKVSIKIGQPCPACGKSLIEPKIDENSVDLLKEAIREKVVLGGDIHRNSNPVEWERFQNFLMEKPPFDVVVDGLNLHYLTSLRRNRVAAMEYLLSLRKDNQGFFFSVFTPTRRDVRSKKNEELMQRWKDSTKLKILYIARTHLRRELANLLPSRKLPSDIDFYFLDDLSKDDAFILYAALYSGLGTTVISQDMMRAHRYLVGKESLKTTFVTWQKKYQVKLEFDMKKGIVIKKPYQFDLVPQQSLDENSWHIPISPPDRNYSDTVDNKYIAFEERFDWICFNKR